MQNTKRQYKRLKMKEIGFGNMQEKIKKMEEYATLNNIPIMQKDGIEFLLDYIKNNNIKNILEIGTAIGYSSIRMALLDDNTKVTTIERDINRYNEAIKNIKEFNLEDRINVILKDALEVELNDKYDLIFIDAAKAQNIKFFEKYKNNLKDNGTIITDNMYFHGLIFKDKSEIESRNLKQLVRKLNNYHKFLKENKEFNTKIIEVGDGIAISKKN